MLRLVIFISSLLVAQVSCQSCQLKLDCGSEQYENDPGNVLSRGKQGPKGEKGELGPQGREGANNSEILIRYEEKLDYLENLVQNQTRKLNQMAEKFEATVIEFEKKIITKKLTYKLISEPKTWTDAEAYCANTFDNGHLAFNDVDTQQGRVDLCEKVNSIINTWIGLRKTSGVWYKSDGTLVSANFQYTWFPGTPAKPVNYDYMFMTCRNDSNRGNVWNYYNNHLAYFICQYFC